MSDGAAAPIDPMVSAASVTSTQGSDPAAAAAAGKFNVDPSVVVSSLGDLQTLAPDAHKAMMKTVADSILKQMREHADRLKKIIRDGQIK